MVGLGDQRNDGGTRVTTNDRNELVGRVGLLDLRDEARGTDNVQGGNTEDALGVVDTLRLEDLSNNGDGGVDLFPMSESWTTSKLHNQWRYQIDLSATYRVGDNEDVSVRSSISTGLGKVTDDRGVGVEEV